MGAGFEPALNLATLHTRHRCVNVIKLVKPAVGVINLVMNMKSYQLATVPGRLGFEQADLQLALEVGYAFPTPSTFAMHGRPSTSHQHRSRSFGHKKTVQQVDWPVLALNQLHNA